MQKLTVEEVIEFMKTKKNVTAEKIEAYTYGSKTAYIVNENYRVALETKGSILPNSVGFNYTPKITGRKITKGEYKRIMEERELKLVK